MLRSYSVVDRATYLNQRIAGRLRLESVSQLIAESYMTHEAARERCVVGEGAAAVSVGALPGEEAWVAVDGDEPPSLGKLPYPADHVR